MERGRDDPFSRAVRAFGIVAGVLSSVALAATLVWLVFVFHLRPLDGVEGDVLFEADRIRAGLPLYVDPAVGAFDYGPVPARYHVLYPPLWPALLSLVPQGAAASFARAVAASSWWLLVGMIAWKARAACRGPASIASLFVGSVWVLGLYGSAGRPDALAVLFTGLALERTTRRSSVRGVVALDPVAGALFALAAWTKPNVIGIAPGAVIGAVVYATFAARTGKPRGDVVRGLLAASAVAVVVALVLAKLTGGAFLGHLLASTGQPPSLALWLEQTRDRAPFFAVLFGVAFALGVKNRSDAGVAIALGALVSSVGWCFVSLAKTGSASNYFLEPCVAALVVVARAPMAFSSRTQVVIASLAALQALWTGTASVKSALSSMRGAEARAQALAEVRAACKSSSDDLVVADEPGLERMLNGRIVQTPYQSTHLARAGRFPVAAWIADVTHPTVRCLVMQDDLLERPLEVVDVEHDRFGPELRRALRETFVKRSEREGVHLYERRPQR